MGGGGGGGGGIYKGSVVSSNKGGSGARVLCFQALNHAARSSNNRLPV